MLRAHLKLGRQDARRRALELLRQVSIPDPERRVDAYPHEMSGGMAQRVVMAIALACSPKLIISDDATSAEIIDLLIRMQQEFGTAYLFISHDLSAVRHISNRVAVLYLGMIVEHGSSEKLFAQPSHPYSAGLLSSVLLPNPRIRQKSRINLAGEIPSPINLPKACYLAGRCPLVIEKCRQHMPQLEEIAADHQVRCYRHQDVVRDSDTVDYFQSFQDEVERVLSAGVPERVQDATAK